MGRAGVDNGGLFTLPKVVSMSVVTVSNSAAANFTVKAVFLSKG
jgi:hypothetical protein